MSLDATLQALTLPSGTEFPGTPQELHDRQAANMRRYRERHRETLRQRDRERYHAKRKAAKTDPEAARKLAEEKAKDAAYMKGYYRKYRAEHLDQIRISNARWKQNLKKDRKKASAYYKRENERRKRWLKQHPEKVREYHLRWSRSEKGRIRINASRVELRRRSAQAHLKHKLRCRLNVALKKRYKKASRTLSLLGCSLSEFQKHLEALFSPGMSWDNRGAWEIDHKRPCASFDMADPEQQKECFHFSNLQPLWRTDNRKKSHQWAA